MTSWFSTIGKVVLVLGLMAFLSLGIFGMSHSTMSMEPDGSMTMTNCPLMTGQAVVCNMNPLEHIAAWQNMFTTTLQQNGSDVLTLLLVALALTLIWARSLWPRLKQDLQPRFSIIWHRKEILPPSLLQELFSNGILNPKLF
jgi:hypothetical protein